MADRRRARETMTLECELAMLDALVGHLGLERFSVVAELRERRDGRGPARADARDRRSRDAGRGARSDARRAPPWRPCDPAPRRGAARGAHPDGRARRARSRRAAAVVRRYVRGPRGDAPFLAVTAPPRESPVEVDELSPREREVLRLVADGLSEPTRRAPVSSDPAERMARSGQRKMARPCEVQ